MLLQIPYGSTTTNKALAQRIAKERGIERMSTQAVGEAVTHNSISLIIPCHLCIGKAKTCTGEVVADRRSAYG